MLVLFWLIAAIVINFIIVKLVIGKRDNVDYEPLPLDEDTFRFKAVEEPDKADGYGSTFHPVLFNDD